MAHCIATVSPIFNLSINEGVNQVGNSKDDRSDKDPTNLVRKGLIVSTISWGPDLMITSSIHLKNKDSEPRASK